MTRTPRSDVERREVLGKIVEQELTRAEGGSSDEVQSNRELALRYYRGELPGIVEDNRGSDVVSMDVANTVNAILATMRDMLIKDAELVIEAEGEADEAMAQAEASICTDVLMKDNRGELLLMEAIKTGLLMRNGAMKVISPGGGVLVAGVPIENVCYRAGWDGPFQELPFFAERLSYSRSELVDSGVARSVVDGLPASSDYATETGRARDAVAVVTADGETRDQEHIECHEAYVLSDLNGDGISERYVCLVANGKTCLDFSEIDHIPYALGSPFLNPYRITGESVFDRVRHIQDSNTVMLRQWHNNIAVVNNGRYVYDPSLANEGDIMHPIAGGGIRARNPSTSVVPLQVLDMTSGIAAAIDYNRRQRTEAVGAALDMASAEAQLANKAATAAAIEKGNQELVSSMIAATFAETLVQPLYELIHLYLRRYARRPYLARIQGQAVPVDPSRWGNRRRMTLRCGLPPGVKAMQQQAMMLHVQTSAQAMTMGLGGVLVSPQTLYRSQIRLLKLNGIEDAESFIVDPSSPEAQQAAQGQQQAQQAAQAAQLQLMQAQLQLEQAKIREDARQADGELQHKFYATDMEAQIEEAKIAGQGVIDLEKQRMADEAARQARAAGGNPGAEGGAE